MTSADVVAVNPHHLVEAHNRGKVSEQWAEKLAEVSKAVRDTGRKGSVSLVITMKPDAESKVDNLVEFDVSVSAKVPQKKHPRKLYYVGKRGELTEDDPRQMQLPQA